MLLGDCNFVCNPLVLIGKLHDIVQNNFSQRKVDICQRQCGSQVQKRLNLHSTISLEFTHVLKHFKYSNAFWKTSITGYDPVIHSLRNSSRYDFHWMTQHKQVHQLYQQLFCISISELLQ